MAAQGAIIDPQGKWLGPWPMDGADDCRTKLFADGRFDFECRGKSKYAGMGRWRRDVSHLIFDFSLYVRDGKKVEGMPMMKVRIDGARNTMCVGLEEDRGEPYCWKRAHL